MQRDPYTISPIDKWLFTLKSFSLGKIGKAGLLWLFVIEHGSYFFFYEAHALSVVVW